MNIISQSLALFATAPLTRIQSTTDSVSKVSYPINSVGPNLSLISNQTLSISASPDLNPATLELSFWRNIALSNPSMSTEIPFVRNASSVKSTGKPYVSYSLKAISPLRISPRERPAIALFRSVVPRPRVFKNLSSSCKNVDSMLNFALLSSLNVSPISLINVGTKRCINGSFEPKICACLIARRIIRRRT